VALAIATCAVGLAAWLVLAETVFEPLDKHGSEFVQLTVESKEVGRDLGVNVIVPPRAGPRGERSLLVFLHGRGGSEDTFNDVVLEGLPALRGRQPVVAFPDGGDHGYFHDREEGDWDAYVTGEVIPLLERRFGIDPEKLAIGGISMGGFGAYDIALHHPGMFCAVGGHSPALWFEGGETAPGAFDDAADFERNDVVGAVEEDPDAFGDTLVWNDYGSEDDFRVYDEGFAAAMSGDPAFVTHTWPGGHEASYWAEHWPDYQRFYARALAAC
jgi:S-formylglutathione hydrolase FrmB